MPQLMLVHKAQLWELFSRSNFGGQRSNFPAISYHLVWSSVNGKSRVKWPPSLNICIATQLHTWVLCLKTQGSSKPFWKPGYSVWKPVTSFQTCYLQSYITATYLGSLPENPGYLKTPGFSVWKPDKLSNLLSAKLHSYILGFPARKPRDSWVFCLKTWQVFRIWQQY